MNLPRVVVVALAELSSYSYFFLLSFLSFFLLDLDLDFKSSHRKYPNILFCAIRRSRLRLREETPEKKEQKSTLERKKGSKRRKEGKRKSGNRHRKKATNKQANKQTNKQTEKGMLRCINRRLISSYWRSNGSNNSLRRRSSSSSASASSVSTFQLDNDFVNSFENRPAPFGFNGLGEVVFQRTYSRFRDELGRHEMWHETVARVVEGTFRMQQQHLKHEFCANTAQEQARRMYELIFKMKFLPPGRGLWGMGTPITEERQLFAALNNCGFVSTGEMLAEHPAEPFTFLMDAAMLGVGVGFDTLGEKYAVPPLRKGAEEKETHIIADSSEGWVSSLHELLHAYLVEGSLPPRFDYSEIRPRGLSDSRLWRDQFWARPTSRAP